MKPDVENNSLEPTGEFAALIRDFRSAVMHVGKRETTRPLNAGWLVSAKKRHKTAQQRTALAWVCAALLCFAMLPLSRNSRPSPGVPPSVSVAASQSPAPESDTALLEQVDTDISQSVPSSLAPLADLDNWNTTSASTSSDSSAHGSSHVNPESTNVTQ